MFPQRPGFCITSEWGGEGVGQWFTTSRPFPGAEVPGCMENCSKNKAQQSWNRKLWSSRVAQPVKDLTLCVSVRMWVGSLSGLRILCCHRPPCYCRPQLQLWFNPGLGTFIYCRCSWKRISPPQKKIQKNFIWANSMAGFCHNFCLPSSFFMYLQLGKDEKSRVGRRWNICGLWSARTWTGIRKPRKLLPHPPPPDIRSEKTSALRRRGPMAADLWHNQVWASEHQSAPIHPQKQVKGKREGKKQPNSEWI